MVVCSQEINVLSHRLDSTRFHFNVSLNITANDKRRVLTDINQTVILESYCTCKIWKVKKRSRKIFIQRFNFCLFFLSNMFLEYYFSSCEWFLYCGTIVYINSAQKLNLACIVTSLCILSVIFSV